MNKKIEKLGIGFHNGDLPMPAHSENEAYMMSAICGIGAKLDEVIDRLNEENKVMSAKEMFEKLGYRQLISRNYIHNDISHITYVKENTDITFWFDDKTVCAEFTEMKLTEKELQAINKQVEELGWNK